MSPGFSSREEEVRRLGRSLERFVLEEDPAAESLYARCIQLPSTEVPFLGDAIVSLCQGRLGGHDKRLTRRLHKFGTRLVGEMGLSLSAKDINERVVPLLCEAVRGFEGMENSSLEDRRAQYLRFSALTHLAPRMDDFALLNSISACLESAKGISALESFLSFFERAYREPERFDGAPIVMRAMCASLWGVNAVLRDCICMLANSDADARTMNVDMFRGLRFASLAWLSMLPSVGRRDDSETRECIHEILDSTEWILSRGRGFPGTIDQPEDIDAFEKIRAKLSLAAGILGIINPSYVDSVRAMRKADAFGPRRLGAVVLGAALEHESGTARHKSVGIALAELERYVRSRRGESYSDALIEAAAITWLLGVGDSPLVPDALERHLTPEQRHFLSKADGGTPWRE